MNFASFFSGIEAASAAWLPLGARCIAVAEVDAFPCAVLAERYPDVPNLGDVNADDFLERVTALRADVIIGGPPCQDFSVAGLRAGIDGDRGNLTFRWVEIIHASNARFAVTENVPGWLTVNDGLAFGSFLGRLVGHGAALVPPASAGGRWTNAGMVDGPLGRAAWRILDARYFHLAQRRERVFVVFCPRNGGDPAQVLLEPQGVRRDTQAGRGAREDLTGTLNARTRGGGGLGTDFECGGGLVPGVAFAIQERAVSTGTGGPDGVGVREGIAYTLEARHHVQGVAYGCNNTSGPIDVAGALNASHTASGRQDFETETFVATVAPALSKSNPYGDHESREGLLVAHTLKGEGFDASEDGTGRGTPLVAFQDRFRGDDGRGYDRSPPSGEIPGALETVKSWNVAGPSAVRRLTPRECERLQGFPDDYTLIPWRNGMASDGPRYRALGNSFAVPVVRWIGERLMKVAHQC